MPQMAPMNWLMLMMTFLIMTMTFMSMNYFSTKYTNKLMSKKKSKESNWKW